ncbi:ABC transporter substrate-binding protein [Rubrivivax albus]|uniref:ABC transporter substrate-binding protein n=1 Tax=Rubrivivax albus TaxID=2499835 RepID=A0A3S2UNA3_9BURK|nr:ABC transporter substrate-binding protein [Rubrivivax albus]RVT49744.1 ABC transporter substrate-binding protein [Rubrivivax albus]
MQRRHLLSAAAALAAAAPLRAQGGWAAIEGAARGQTVVFNAWGGSERTNAYLQWVAAELKARHGVVLEHVKLADTAEFVRRIRAERAAGRARGSADLVWINGENFLTMKREGLLHGPWAEQLPNFALVDVQGKPTTRIDFAEPVEGLEAPWGMAQLSFFVDTARAPLPAPATLDGLLDWARRHPGRFTYPKPPQFVGTTFLKQAMATLNGDRSALARPHAPEAFAALTPALWRHLDALHPLLWRGGKAFPASPAAADQMLADGELAMGMSFNPNHAANAIAAKRFPATVRAFQLDGGTIGNTHFVAIPFNAPAQAGAQVVANFLLSPLAQARKADLSVWGDPTVLAVDRLPAAERALFAGAAMPGQVQQPAPVIPEPHGSWVEPLETAWLRRYGA